MSLIERGDIYFIQTNDVELRIGKSNHIILNPEVIDDMYGVKIGSNVTLSQLKDIASKSSIRAFRSFVDNVDRIVNDKEDRKPRSDKIITVTETIVKRESNPETIAILAKISSMIKLAFFVFIVVIVICVTFIARGDFFKKSNS